MYPTITASKADEVAEILLANYQAHTANIDDRDFLDLEKNFVVNAEGADVDVSELYKIPDRIKRAVPEAARASVYVLEELWATQLHRELDKLDAKALQDPGFWRFLALFPFRSYVNRREPDWKPLRYGGGKEQKPHYWTLPRTYLWGQRCLDPNTGDYDLVTKLREERIKAGLSEGTIIDFYSHVIRDQWARHPKVAQGFIRGYLVPPVKFDINNKSTRPSNELAKAFARVGNNICLEFLDQEEIEAFAVEECQKIVETGLTADVIDGELPDETDLEV